MNTPAAKQPKTPKPKRPSATSAENIGDDRYDLIRSAAERIASATDAGYYLEATTLIESVVADRLEKRLQFLLKNHPEADSKKDFREAKEGFADLGTLLRILTTLEKEDDLRRVLVDINHWRRERNRVIHQMAKLGDTVTETWDERIEHAHGVAKNGVKVLRELDLIDRRLSHIGRGTKHASATCPDALGAIGQPPCEWCAAPSR